MLRSIGKQSGESVESGRRKGRLRWEGFAEKEGFKPEINGGGGVMYSKSVTVDDFRGIAISPVLSKVFEHCLLNRYCDYFVTSNNQFGFKKNIS